MLVCFYCNHCNLSLAACDVINQHMGRKVTTPPTKEQQNAILTPEAPSIAFPLPKPQVALEPQAEVNVYTNKRFLYT